VVDDELRTTVEQLLEGLGSVGAIEHVRLRDTLPRKVATLYAQLIAEAGELLLFRQQRFALCDPLLVRNDPMIRDVARLCRGFAHSCPLVSPFTYGRDFVIFVNRQRA
jgi:hypothetical protein